MIVKFGFNYGPTLDYWATDKLMKDVLTLHQQTITMAATPQKFQFQNLQILRKECLGTGSYGKVCKAILDQLPCAVKLLHPVLFQFNDPASQTIVRRFEQECEFLSEIRHPHVVQYLSVARDPESGLLVLLMELMDESLTGFLERSNEPLPYHLQVSLCHDVALALAYLHLNGIIHRDLSSNNVLLIAGSRAKVTDFGMSKLSQMHPRMTPLTQCPGTAVYMAPEALRNPPVYSEKLDIFSTGVIAVQIMTRNFPDPGPAMTAHKDPRYPTGTILVPTPEIERRKNDIDMIDAAHPLLLVALDCLKDGDIERLSAPQLCHCLAALRETSKFTKSKQQVQGGQVEVQERRIREQQQREIQEKQREIQVKDEQLGQKDQEIEQNLRELQAKDRELEQNTRDLQVKDRKNQELQVELREKNRVIEQLRSRKGEAYAYKVSGPGLQCATANTTAHFSVEVLDSDGQPIHSEQLVTAEMKRKGGAKASKAQVVRSSYEVSYTPQLRGCYTLHVKVNGTEIQAASPLMVIVYPDPTQLHHPVRVIEGVHEPYGAAINSHGEMYVTERFNGQVAVFDSSGKRINTIGSKGHGPGQFLSPCCIAIDTNDNIYVTSNHKLQKFNRNGEFVKSVGSGSSGRKPGEFNNPRGVKIYQNQIYMCDKDNNRIQVFDLELSFIKSFGCKGFGQREFDGPNDLAFDSQGNIYVIESNSNRVQILGNNHRYLRQFGNKGAPGKLSHPEGINIAHDCVYISDCDNQCHCIAVFQLSGAFLAYVGKSGTRRGEFQHPKGIVFDCDGFLYVCDWLNDRIQVF